MASKLELAAILAAACGMLSIEHGNHTFTDAPTRTERSALAAADCPGNDSMPYPESCLIFLDAKLESDVRHLDAAGKSALAQPDAVKQDESILPDAECPAKDTVPYSASCIAFLTTGRSIFSQTGRMFNLLRGERRDASAGHLRK
jgi:hypothetical protein